MAHLRRITVVAALVAALCLGTASAMPTRLAGITAPSVDVRAYGAKGNGSHDDTAAIRRAMRAVSAAGGTVRFARGVYKVSAITVPNGVSLVGAGMNVCWIRGRVTAGSHVTLRDLKVGAKGYSFRLTAKARLSTFEHVRFRGGGGSGGDAPVILLGDWARSCDHITFKDCKVECNLGVEDSSFSRGFNNIRITENAAPGGAHVDSITFDGCRIGVSNGVRSGCPRMSLEAYTADLAGTGVFTHGWSNLKIIGCVFEAADWYNIDLADHAKPDGSRASGPALVSGCTLKGAANYTICVESPKGVVIENNTIYRAATNTFKMGWRDMSTVDPATVVRNNLFDLTVNNGFSAGSPLFWLKGGDNRFTGNTVKTTSTGRIFELTQARDNTVTGNLLTVPASATLFAVDEGCSGNVLSPNTVN